MLPPTSLTTSLQSSSLVTSNFSTNVFSSLPILLAVSRAALSFTSETSTLAPSCTNRVAIARPNPDPAPGKKNHKTAAVSIFLLGRSRSKSRSKKGKQKQMGEKWMRREREAYLLRWRFCSRGGGLVVAFCLRGWGRGSARVEVCWQRKGKYRS